MAFVFYFLVLLSTIYQPCLGDDLTDVFEFGRNKGKVTFSTSGSIGLLDKTTVIHVKTPDCTKITYVRVEVRNKLAPPYVKFDDDMSAVIIKYRPLQYSISNYVVLAKTKKVECEREEKSDEKEENYNDSNNS